MYFIKPDIAVGKVTFVSIVAKEQSSIKFHALPCILKFCQKLHKFLMLHGLMMESTFFSFASFPIQTVQVSSEREVEKFFSFQLLNPKFLWIAEANSW